MNCAMIVAVVSVWMMQVAIHQIVGMVAVGHRLMSAVRTVLVFRPMCVTVMSLAAFGRVLGVDIESVLIDVAFMQ